VIHRPFLSRLALACALIAALGMTACGRKGPLDLPPGAGAADPPSGSPAERSATPAQPTIGPDGQPIAPQGPTRRIPLDLLID
jgi:predicted small lipoprotein YifL